MKHSIRIKINCVNILIVIIALCSISASFLIIYNRLVNSKGYYTVNDERIMTNIIMNNLENNYDSMLMGNDEVFKAANRELKKINSQLIIIDLTGKVIFDSKDENILSKNIFVDIRQSVEYDKSFQSNNPLRIKYSFPVVIGGQQKASAIFTLASEKDLKNVMRNNAIIAMIPMMMGFIAIVSIVLFINLKLKKEVLEPIEELNIAAENIAAGNFNKKIKYNDNSELGVFCNHFEFMRDELKASISKEMQLEKSRKELIACISHDLRTPITSIKAYVEALQDGIAKDKEIVDKYIKVIARKTESLVKLINDLFQYSQAELGEFTVNKKEGYSNNILEKILNPISLEINAAELNFIIEKPFPDVIINVDSLRLEQVIMNLIQNAKKYTSAGGTISFKAELEGAFIKISIKDTGMGISQRDLPFIFEKFYRGEKSRSRDFGGAGLGLYICKYIVELQGGTISVESKEDEGSIFSFTIPKV